MKDCTTCKYGYEDERLGIPMCHHPKRFLEDCIDFNMHEEKEIKEPEKPVPNDLEEAARRYGFEEYRRRCEGGEYGTSEDAFIAGAKWDREQMMKEAVEGMVKYHDYPEYKYVLVPYEEFNDGDKVRIIIVKED